MADEAEAPPTASPTNDLRPKLKRDDDDDSSSGGSNSNRNSGSGSGSTKILLLGGLGRVARVFCFLALSENNNADNNSEISVFDAAPDDDDGDDQNDLLRLPNGIVVSRLPQRNIAELDAALFSRYDVVVNALPVSFSETVLAVASRSTCSIYVDVASNAVEWPPEQWRYHDQFRQQGRLLLSGVGVAPGLDNLLVAQLVDDAGGAMTRVQIYLIEHCCTNDDNDNDNDYIPSWCEQDAALSAADLPVSYDGTKLVRHEPFGEPEELDTAMGPFRFYRFFGEEVISLARHYPALQIDHRAGGGEVEVAREAFQQKQQPPMRLGATTTAPDDEAATTATPSSSSSSSSSSSTAAAAAPAIGKEEKEPDGVFGVKIVSDAGTAQVILKSTAQLRAEGLPGNHISFHTGAMLYYSLQHAVEYNNRRRDTSNTNELLLTGTVFPEQLPLAVRAKILNDVRAKLATHYSIDIIGNNNNKQVS